jgi:hypothetical protein
MKLTRIKLILAAALALANGFFAGAQSNNVPGDTDYASFSQFIADRNIFDPNRYPRNSRPRPTYTHVIRHTAGAPEFTLVGTMNYRKGMFVFFDGNNSDLRKVLVIGGSIAGYTVEEVTATSVKLMGADKKEIEMKLGDQMRQEDGNWQLAGQAELPGSAATMETGNSGNSTTSTDAQPVAPSPGLESNDVLKRLMQQREQELK